MKYLLIIFFVLCGTLFAIEATTLEQARQMSQQESKPILMEFGREDCDYCQKAEEETKKNEQVQKALKDFIYLKMNVAISEQYEIAEKYKIGFTYPVYLMTNVEGEPIYRWTGFYGVPHFLNEINKAKAIKITITERAEKLKSDPKYDDAFFLAEYFAETQNYLKAIEYYRRAEQINNKTSYSYQIFTNSAEACWNGLLPFSEVMAAADKVEPDNIISVAKVITNCARRAKTTDQVGKYIERALEVVPSIGGKNSQNDKYELLAEKALYVENDLSKSLRIVKIMLGSGWQNDPERYFKFAQWCQKRNVNLDKAEQYARQAADHASPGILKGRVYNTLAEIYSQQGNIVEAIRSQEKAIDETPSNEYYHQQLGKYKDYFKNQSDN